MTSTMTSPSNPTKKERWWAWHLENPHVYRLFKRFTFQALMKRRHKHLGAWLVVNRIRWETSIETTGEDFKISNDFVACYSRMYHYLYPAYDGLFRIKEAKRLVDFELFLKSKLGVQP